MQLVLFNFSLKNIFEKKNGLGTSYNNMSWCPLPSIYTHILSQVEEASLQYIIYNFECWTWS